jgi:hypothetical protein
MFCSCAHHEGNEDSQGIRQFILKLVTKWRWSVWRPGHLVSEERATGTYRVRWMSHIVFDYTPICPPEHDKQRTPHPWNVAITKWSVVAIHTEVLNCRMFSRECDLVLPPSASIIFTNVISSCLWFLPRLPIAFVFPWITCFKRKSLQWVWP